MDQVPFCNYHPLCIMRIVGLVIVLKRESLLALPYPSKRARTQSKGYRPTYLVIIRIDLLVVGISRTVSHLLLLHLVAENLCSRG